VKIKFGKYKAEYPLTGKKIVEAEFGFQAEAVLNP
jgi:hypothetical protein